MTRPRLLDLFCGAGGAARGYQLAGFEVWGVDIAPQPSYVGERFQQADALEYVERYGVDNFDAIHASPPCQFYAGLSDSTKHWRSIPPTRELLEATGLPYVIENIADAAWDMRSPVRLCGSMFGLGVRRHRLFETTLPFFMQQPCSHAQQGEIRAYYGKPGWAAWTPKGANVQKKGRKPLLRGSVELAPADMGIDWMTWDELREAIPPAYCEFIGTQLLSWLHASGRLPAGSSLAHTPGTSAFPGRKTGSHPNTDAPGDSVSFGRYVPSTSVANDASFRRSVRRPGGGGSRNAS